MDYVINTPDRRKAKCLCHVNVMKPYVERAGNSEQPVKHPVSVLTVKKGPVDPVVVPSVCNVTSDSMKRKNSDILGNIRYRSDTTSHTLDIFVESRVRVEQTYFSTLTARRCRYSATI